jgi:hypothetical protein
MQNPSRVPLGSAASPRTHTGYWRRIGLWLVGATMGYNVLEGIVDPWAGLHAGSIALVGFGFDSFIECAAAAALFWRLGIEARGAEVLVAKWGSDVGRFGIASRLAAWTGVAPGHEESAGKQHSGKTHPGKGVLRAAFTQLAYAASRTKGTYPSALYQRLGGLPGKKRPIMAVAHMIVVTAFHIPSLNISCRELKPMTLMTISEHIFSTNSRGESNNSAIA